MSDNLKRAAAERAAGLVTDGMRLGLGTGSTAAHFVAAIGERVRGGLKVVGVPTSEATRDQAQREGIPLSTLDETPDLDLTVDGADELDDDLRLIKGGGGALLREKIVASASQRMIIIADGSEACGEARAGSRCPSRWCPSASRPPSGPSSAPGQPRDGAASCVLPMPPTARPM